MRLNIFNSWKNLTKWSDYVLEYKTTQRGDTWMTIIREKNSEQPIVSAISRNSKDEALERAVRNIRQVGVEGIAQAIESKQLVNPVQTQPVEKDIDWRDGSNHRYRAQKKIVDK